jgi:hypothetical protein
MNSFDGFDPGQPPRSYWEPEPVDGLVDEVWSDWAWLADCFEGDSDALGKAIAEFRKRRGSAEAVIRELNAWLDGRLRIAARDYLEEVDA